ncbi:MAG: endonuclease [Elusimicrobia bacterium]|nr:endonuclease [Elusimicrobiota bacterium]
MTTRSCGRWAVLTSWLLATALPAASQQVVYQPVRLPAAVLAAPMVGTHLGAMAAPTLHATLSPSLLTPSLSPSLMPRVQVPSLSPSAVPQVAVPGLVPAPSAGRTVAAPDWAKSWVPNAAGLHVPAGHESLATDSSAELHKAISDPRGASLSQVFSSVYDGHSRAAAAVDLSPAEAPAAPAAGYLAEARGLSGSQLLGSLHQITGRNYHSHDYREASQYLFGTAYNITSHGVRGVIDAYSGIFVPGTSHNGGDYSEGGDQDGDGYPERDGMNVEHPWPQSFFDKALPMRSDLHHLLPTFQHPNSMRSNLPFGEVKGSPDYSNNAGAKEGGGVFEPPDVSKGLVARHVLYFYTRYYDRNIMQGAYNHGFFKDRIDMFLRWNREHPPTADELRANDLIEKYQGNRNPFVDDPALADRIGAEGFGAGPGFAKAQPSARQFEPSRQSPDRGQEPERRHGKHHHGGNDRRYAAPAAPARLSPLDFALN